ncbi:hypothetical protein Tco_1251921, partial [Tanacetum coccineum]
QTSKSPNDEERAITNDEDNALNSPNSSNTIKDESGNSTSMGDKSISKGNSQHTQNVLIFSDQNNVGSHIPSNISTKNNEGMQPTGNRRSTRTTKMPAKFNDYVVNSSTVGPNNYFVALKDKNWVEAMNAEIEALNRNNTWTINDLPKGRKLIVQNGWHLFQLDVNNAFL